MVSGHTENAIPLFSLPVSDPVLVFAILLLVVLLSPLILKKIRIPGIIGLILFGLLLGPHALNILEKNDAIDLFSTIGLLYIMFIAGLDLDLEEFSRSKYRSIGFGAMTFIVPMSIGFLVFHLLLHFEILPSLLIASIFSTQTLVAYPIVSKLGLSNNRAVVVTVGGTIITDTAVLIMLAVLTGMHSDSLSWMWLLKLLDGFTIVILILFFLMPPISRWFFKRVTGDQNAHFVYVLAMVFLSGYLTKLAGIEPIVGAFFAGLVFNKIIPRTSILMNRLIFVGNALFIPFFLLGIGMMINPGILFSAGPTLWIALVMIAVSITGKRTVAVISSYIFGFNSNEKNLLHGLSSSHAAATLAIILIGFQKGLIDESLLNGGVLLVLTSCLLAALLTDRAARKILVSQNEDITVLPDKEKIQRILLPVAKWDNLPSLLEFALLLGNNKTGTSIHVLSVVDNDHDAEKNLTLARKKLELFSKEANASDTKVFTHATIDYNLTQGIIRSARELEISSIVMGWPGGSRSAAKFIQPFADRTAPGHDRDIFLIHLANPLESVKRLVLLTPEFFEKEAGLMIWLNRFYSIAKQINRQIINIPIKEYTADGQADNNEKRIRPGDFIILFAAREGSLTWDYRYVELPDLVKNQHKNNNLAVLLPRTTMLTNRYTGYQDLTGNLLKPYSLLKRRTN